MISNELRILNELSQETLHDKNWVRSCLFYGSSYRYQAVEAGPSDEKLYFTIGTVVLEKYNFLFYMWFYMILFK